MKFPERELEDDDLLRIWDISIALSKSMSNQDMAFIFLEILFVLELFSCKALS